MPHPEALSIQTLVDQRKCCGGECLLCPYDPPFTAKSYRINREWIAYYAQHPESTREEFEEVLQSSEGTTSE